MSDILSISFPVAHTFYGLPHLSCIQPLSIASSIAIVLRVLSRYAKLICCSVVSEFLAISPTSICSQNFSHYTTQSQPLS